MTLAERCAAITALVLDVDGVLTSGGIIWDGQGIETKAFHVRDGAAIKRWQKMGKKLALLSGRNSLVTNIRGNELGFDTIVQGNPDKLPGWREIMSGWNIEPRHVAYMGDDWIDAPILNQAGLALTVADAHPTALSAAQFISKSDGGRGAVCEAIELILHVQSSGMK